MHVLKAFPLLGEQGVELVIDNDSGNPFLTGEARITASVTLTV